MITTITISMTMMMLMVTEELEIKGSFPHPPPFSLSVDLTEVDPGGFQILIGGDMTPGSGMTPIASQAMISPEQQVSYYWIY